MSGYPFQVKLMNENSRCSILFPLARPGRVVAAQTPRHGLITDGMPLSAQLLRDRLGRLVSHRNALIGSPPGAASTSLPRLRNSDTALVIVVRDIPVNCDSRVIPPRP
jgi:hypothetical protein